ncbi:hypothetical protein VN1175_04740 [Helicobacter pylori]|nr:hypothetical protein VN1175_04740 [Helicobacter pylori]
MVVLSCSYSTLKLTKYFLWLQEIPICLILALGGEVSVHVHEQGHFHEGEYLEAFISAFFQREALIIPRKRLFGELGVFELGKAPVLNLKSVFKSPFNIHA